MKKPSEQPFRSRAERERDRELAERYREIGSAELVAEIRREKQQQQGEAEPDQKLQQR